MSKSTACLSPNTVSFNGVLSRLSLEKRECPGHRFQANLLDDLPSRVMVPLHPVQELSWSISRLNPRFSIEGEAYVTATQRMASIPTTELGGAIADLTADSDRIVAAVDFLFQDF